MSFRQLALSNIRGSAQRYAAFFLSSVFSVLLFYMYAQFIFHPDVTNGYIYGGENARVAMIVCEFLIIIFSFFFVLYSSGSFLRARHKEFGLLSLLGTSRRQLRRLIWLENTILSVAAISVGIGLGLLFSKLFLMGISRVLMTEVPIRFVVVPEAVALTAAGFFLLFQVITLFSAFSVGRQKVIDLLGAARKPKALPRASPVLTILSILLIGGGYFIAVTIPPVAVVVAFFPVVGMVVAGTYLLFGQLSVFVLRRLQRRPRFYLSGTRTLVISRLVFRMKDNARLLASVATLSAVVLSAAGTLYIVSSGFTRAIVELQPQAYSITQPVDTTAPIPAPEQIEEILAGHGVTPSVRIDVQGVTVELLDGEGDTTREISVVALSESDYRAIVARTGTPVVGSQWRDPAREGEHELPSLANGESLLISPYSVQVTTDGPDPSAITVATPELANSQVIASFDQVLVNPTPWSAPWLILPDEQMDALAAARPGDRVRLYAVDWPGSNRTTQLNRELTALVDPEAFTYVGDRGGALLEIRQVLGLSMFVGIFVSVLFFIAAGSMIYFKLFTELAEDRQLFRSLRRLGITQAETRAVVSGQMWLIFFLPFLVGAIHSLFALNTLGNMMGQSVLEYSLLVVGLFGLVQAAFYLLTRVTYMRALRM